jgi:calmodulin
LSAAAERRADSELIRGATLVDERIEELRESFAACDRNQDGKIQYEEFAELVDNLGFELESSECRIGFRELDRDGDGVIDFDEFLSWWTDH